jgi:AcrR family transcriptional regulator
MPEVARSRDLISGRERRPGGAKRRAEIVRHAVELFAAQGYAATPLAEIADAVGIRKASLYNYIESKEDLLYEIDRLLISELEEETERLLRDANGADARLRAFLTAGMRLIARRRSETTVFLREYHVAKSNRGRWRELADRRHAYQHLFESILRDGAKEGVFRSLPTTVTALGVLGTTSWAFRWYDPDGALGPDAVAALFADVVLDGIRSRPGHDGKPSPRSARSPRGRETGER